MTDTTDNEEQRIEPPPAAGTSKSSARSKVLFSIMRYLVILGLGAVVGLASFYVMKKIGY